MQKLIILIALYSCTSLFGAQEWNTPLCLKVFSPLENMIYANDIWIRGLDILNEDTQVKPIQIEQIANFVFDQPSIGKSYQEALLTFDNAELYYLTLQNMTTGERYTQIQGYRTDTEISALFIEGKTMPIAFTSNHDCYQITEAKIE